MKEQLNNLLKDIHFCLKMGPKACLLFIFLFFNVQVWAQNKEVGDDQIDVVKPYLPTLSDAFKISSSPEKDTLSFHIPEFKYVIPATRIPLNVEVVPIKAVKIKDEDQRPLTPGFFKLGLGNYNTPFIELFVNSSRSKNAMLSAHLSHLSANNALLKNAGYSDYSKNHLALDGKWFTASKELLSASVKYDRNAVHYYGYQRSDTVNLSKDSTLHLFNSLSVEAVLKNMVPKNKEARHEIRLNYQFLKDNLQTNENRILVSGSLNKNFDKFNLGVLGVFNHSSISDRIGNTSRNLISLNPFIENEKADLWKLHAGIRLLSVKDSASKIKVFPEINASYHLADEYVIAFAGFEGDVQQNTFQSYAESNPFIRSVLKYTSTFNSVNVYGGFKGLISPQMPYHIKVSYLESDNVPFFANAPSDKYLNTFMILYDNMTYLRANAELGYFLQNQFSFRLNAGYFKCLSIAKLSKPIHIPEFDVTLSGFYRINADFTARIHLKASGNQYAWINKEPVLVKAWLDAGLGVDYSYSSKLTFFLNINNISNQSNYYWFNYPSQKLNVLAGLSYAF